MIARFKVHLVLLGAVKLSIKAAGLFCINTGRESRVPVAYMCIITYCGQWSRFQLF